MINHEDARVLSKRPPACREDCGALAGSGSRRILVNIKQREREREKATNAQTGGQLAAFVTDLRHARRGL